MSKTTNIFELLRAYFAVISARCRTLLQYRAAAFAGFVTQLFWGAIRIMIFAAFYAVTSDEQPMSFTMVVSYVWLGQALLGILPWNIDTEIAEMIRSGSVSYELARPLDLYNFWFCRTIALRTATTTLRCVPMFIVAVLLLPALGLDGWAMQLPPTWTALLLFLVSIFCAVMLASALTMLMHVALIWTLSGEGLNRIMPSLVTVLSGNIVPLPLFPDWLQPFLNFQPFRGLVDVPFRIYVGDISVAAAFPDILQQVFWIVVIVLLGRWLLTRSMATMVVQGG